MKVLLVLCIVYSISCVYCSVLPTAALVRTPNLDTAIVTSERVGGSFAYSTVEGHAYAPVAPVVQQVVQPVAVSYASAPLAVAHQSIFTHPIYGSQLLTPGLISSPIFGGIVSQTPIAGQPVLGPQAPIFGQGPVQGQYPVQSPIAQPPQGVPQGDAPSPGTVVDEDTVSVESA